MEGLSMAVFKDDKRAAEILSGKMTYPKIPILRYAIILLCLAITGAAVYAVYGQKIADLASASRQAAPAEKIEVKETAVAQPKVVVPMAKPTTPTIEVVEMPPVTMSYRTPDSAAAVKKPAAVAAPLMKGHFAPVYSALKAGKADAAIEALNGIKTHDDAELIKEATVLQARALLAAGKIGDARAKLEPLAFATVETELGADALFGNLFCQAGTMQRLRDSELESISQGAQSWGAAMAALEQARRIDATAGGNVATLENARKLYQQAFDMNKLEDAEQKACLNRLTELTNKLILDPKISSTMPKSVFYKVESGDSVDKIARKFKVNQGQIKRVNRLNDKLVIRYGQTLKILEGEPVYKVDRSDLVGTLYIDGVFIRSYRVGIGPGDATPVGTYVIENKVLNPDWYYDGKRVPFGDPRNILGTRWMGFVGTDNNGQGAGLGVHGTSLPESVPGRESKGCVRMINNEVEELYDFMPQGGKVIIAD
jgi:lipoprotein-anchoring transpeptidase ErfK/SrfK